jgi:CheY-like chemotaxis protein
MESKTIALNNILLIDDDEVSNFVSSHLISDMNLSDNIVVFQFAADALEYIRTNLSKNSHFLEKSLILLDVNMPEMSGFEFLDEYLNSINDYPGAVIIMYITSSFNDAENRKAQNFSNVVSRFIEKPLTEEVVKEIVTNYF